MEQLEAERRDLEARRERLELPAIDREMLSSIVENFERVMAESPNPQKKHLLHQLVKKVLVHARRTLEVWYGLPNRRGFAYWNKWLPGPCSIRNLFGLSRPARKLLRQLGAFTIELSLCQLQHGGINTISHLSNFPLYDKVCGQRQPGGVR